MIGNVVAFVQDAKAGRLSQLSFLRGIASLGGTLPGRIEVPGPTGGLQRPPTTQSYDDLATAVQVLANITAKTCAGELSAQIFLETEFHYERLETGLEGVTLSHILFGGLESLANMYLRVPEQIPLQRWSLIAAATNFVSQSSSLARPHEITLRDRDSLSQYPSVSNIGRERHRSTERAVAVPLNKEDSYSIGLTIERRNGVREDCIEDDSLPGYKRALANWNSLLITCTEDGKLTSILTTPQLDSARILIEWWIGQINNSVSTPDIRQAIERASASGLLDEEAFRIFRISKPDNPGETWDFYQQRMIQPSSGTAYCMLMFRLFQLEFLPYHYDKNISRLALRGTRKQAVRIAACQRVAMSCYNSLLKDFETESRQRAAEADGVSSTSPGKGGSEIVTSDIGSVTSPHPNLDKGNTSTILLGGDSRHFSAEKQRMLQAFIDGGPGFKIGASISPCEWLEDTGTDEDLPYYLWDVEQKRTVVSSKIRGDARYTAVSHTWGRWLLEDAPSLEVEGVDQWMIPQNSKFPVQNLPSLLSLVPTHTRYIWFDLVCIPQKPPEPELIERARLEIGRQAKIFRRAEFAIAWINEDQVQSWSGLRAAIRRLSIHYLQEGGEMHIPQPLLDLVVRDSDLALELFDSKSDPAKLPEELMNGWFSSLWTLQELCLRPDMRLCTKTWELLTVGEDDLTVVGMDDLVALAQGGKFVELQREGVGATPASGSSMSRSPTGMLRQIEARSRATDHLWEMLDLSGVDHLLDASRSTILTLGNQRYCKEFRAEAIMSALGVTDWHTSNEARTSSGDIPSDSLDQYPLEFLKECAEKIGADFYASCLAEGELIEMLVLSLSDKQPSRNVVASMAPFTFSLLSRSPSLAEGYTGRDHPAVSTWQIQPDRSVEIREAGILSYTGQRRTGARSLSCTLVGPSAKAQVPLLVQKQMNIDLDQWIDSFMPSTRNFAVCLHHDLGIVDGLLLKELSSGELIKVGTYILTKRNAYQDPVPPSHSVDWRVI